MNVDMHDVSTAGNSPARKRAPRHLWYYTSLGVIGGAAIILFAVLPESIAGLALVACALAISMFDRLARRFSNSPISTLLQVEAIPYLVSISVVSLGSLALVWIVLRNGNGQPLWLAWAFAVLSGAVGGSGAWVEGRLSRRAASAA
jgi:hypothetical protein